MSDLIFPAHKCGLYLEHNTYKDSYESIEQGVKDEKDWIDGEKDKALKTGEIWTLQWYPNTPVGFCRVVGASLEAVLKASLK